jgi:hypothetical protein
MYSLEIEPLIHDPPRLNDPPVDPSYGLPLWAAADEKVLLRRVDPDVRMNGKHGETVRALSPRQRGLRASLQDEMR